jgi:hypothetical protein
MKRSATIILSLIGLLLFSITATIVSTQEVTTIAETVVNNYEFAAFAFVPGTIVSASITPQIIDELKLKFGHIKIITVEVEPAQLDEQGNEITPAELYQFLVKRPDRGLIKMLLPLAQNGKLDEFTDKAIKNLVVGGDLNALDDGIVFMGVSSQLKEMIAPAQTFLSKA